MPAPATERQASILDFVRDYAAEYGKVPTIREIGRHFQMSPNGVMGHFKALEKKGLLKRPQVVHGRAPARSYQITGASA